MDWKTLLAYISGSVDEELLLRNEYLAAENRILRDQIKGRLQLSDAERQTLAEIGKKLGKQALAEIATVVKPDTILSWNRKLAAKKFDGSEQRKSPGRPRVNQELEDWVVRMAKENRSWGYDRIAGALAELGYDISEALSQMFDTLPVHDDDAMLGNHVFVELRCAIEELSGHLTAAQAAKAARADAPRRRFAAQMERAIAYLVPEEPIQESSSPPGTTRQKTVTPKKRKMGRNERCWCGSGKKYKKCHLDRD